MRWLVVLLPLLLSGCAGSSFVDLAPASIRERVDAGEDVVLPFGGVDTLVRLRLPDRPEPRCVALDENGSYQSCPPTEPSVFEGHVVGDENATVIALLDGEQVRASMSSGSGPSHVIEPCGKLRDDGLRRHQLYRGGDRTWPFC